MRTPAAIAVLLTLVACDSGQDQAPRLDAGLPTGGQADEYRPAAEVLPPEFSALWAPWFGDLDALLERRVVRVVVPYGGYQYFYDGGQPSGALPEILHQFENYLNREHGSRTLKINVIIIPAARDKLIPDLVAGHADLVAGDLTITPARQSQVRFTDAVITGINEVLVVGPQAPRLDGINGLSGQAVFVRPSSSYYEHLVRLAGEFESEGHDPPVLVPADELLEAEDILEMVDAGLVPMTVMDDYKARFWATVFPNLEVREDIVINRGGSTAWAVNSNSEAFANFVNAFLERYGRGTLVGNDILNRYLANADRVRCAAEFRPTDEIESLVGLFRKYGEEYGFDWLMLAAQGYQESRLNQRKRSPAGAVGIMQIKPSTARDPNVGIDDVSTADGNVRAGAKYMRFLADRYFSEPDLARLDRWLLSLAAYNAGPARMINLRREAAQSGYDPGRWFDNVEIIAARRIGRETVEYVSNVFKYYVGYRAAAERLEQSEQRLGAALSDCSENG